jgi:hypothetical protein
LRSISTLSKRVLKVQSGQNMKPAEALMRVVDLAMTIMSVMRSPSEIKSPRGAASNQIHLTGGVLLPERGLGSAALANGFYFAEKRHKGEHRNFHDLGSVPL